MYKTLEKMYVISIYYPARDHWKVFHYDNLPLALLRKRQFSEMSFISKVIFKHKVINN